MAIDNPLDLIKGSPFAHFRDRVGSVDHAARTDRVAPGYQGGFAVAEERLAKAAAAGWQNIPGGKHGGKRRQVGGKWEYQYESSAHAGRAATHHKKEAERSIASANRSGDHAAAFNAHQQRAMMHMQHAKQAEKHASPDADAIDAKHKPKMMEHHAALMDLHSRFRDPPNHIRAEIDHHQKEGGAANAARVAEHKAAKKHHQGKLQGLRDKHPGKLSRPQAVQDQMDHHEAEGRKHSERIG